MIRSGHKLDRLLQCSALAADVCRGLGQAAAVHGPDGARRRAPVPGHLYLQPRVHVQVPEELLGVRAEPVRVLEDVCGLAHQLQVGVADTEPQPRHPVQQWPEMARLLELGEGLADLLITEPDLR